MTIPDLEPPRLASYEPPDDAFRDRVILVTGAGSGIGAALARRLGAAGATIVLLGRKQRKLEQVYDAIIAAHGPQPAIVALDLERAQGPEYDRLAEQLEAAYGRLDGLVNNAGILGDRSPIEHYDQVTWQRVIHVNLTAAFLVTQTCLPLLRRSRDASVLFTSSGVGRVGKAYWGAYAVSKFGIEGLTQVLADELENKPEIRVNCINPGATRTAMRRQAYPAEPARESAAPADILGPYLFLLGPDSRGITGRSLDCQ